MTSISTRCQEAVRRLCADAEVLVDLLGDDSPADDADRAEFIAAVERAGRLLDAARVLAVRPLAADRGVAERLGFASSMAAIATLARVSERTAGDRLRLAEGTMPDRSVSGASLPPRHEHVAQALRSGELGIEAATLVVRELEAVAPRVPGDARRAAEAIMVARACGPVSVNFLAREVRQIGATVDPDGAEPREERAARGRSMRLGRQDDDGLIPISGRLLPEVGVQVQRLFEASRRSPTFLRDGDRALDDTRTPDQRRHDAFAEILMAAAGAESAPRLNGRLVSVLVTVSAADLHRVGGLDSDPIGVMSGSDFPVSRVQVERFIDASGYREVVMTEGGALVGMTSPERCFTGAQAMAIAARDGDLCFTPGCTSPHTALQVHHVVPWRDGGPTSTANGILLCYWHHRRVDDGPWEYRMVRGVPEARGPGVREWQPAQSRRAYAA